MQASESTGTALSDPFGRTVDYLRISVTDRCDERCLYCMPEGYKGWSQKVDHLTTDEIIRSVKAATELGFRKFRVTGGEPLIRRDIVEILGGIWELPGVQTLGVSTNATHLADLAPSLRRAGVRSLNISLDALDPEIYHRITGGRLQPVLDGIQKAREQCFEVIKLNCVLLRSLNECQYLPLIKFAARQGMPLRFIELMPLSTAGVMDDPRFLSVEELLRRLSAIGTLSSRENFRPGYGPARYYEFCHDSLEAPATIGFIGAMTTTHFCATCNKLRLTADGKLRPCLGRHGEIDLRESLRIGGNPADAFREAIANKPENHEFLDSYAPGRPMTAIGG